jgi:hypothetical protein
MGLVVLGGSAIGMSTTPAKAGTISQGGCTNGTYTNWDPVKTQNALTATNDPSRPWDNISSMTATRSGAGATIQLNLCAAVPTFPTTTGDTAAEFQACVDLPANEAIGGTGPVVIGLGHRGGPIFSTGPYPASQGYKVCTWVNFQANVGSNLVSYGVSYYDPIGQFTFYDNSQLKDASGASTLAAPVVSGSSITLTMPGQVIVQLAQNSVTKGGPGETIETWFTATDPMANIVAQAQIAATGTLPFPVCVNASPPGIGCNGQQLVGPVFGVGGLLTTVDSIPGAQQCSTPGIACSNPQIGYDLGLLPIGYPAQSTQTCVSNQPAVPTVSCTASAGTWTTYPCLAADSWATKNQGPFTLGVLPPASSDGAKPTPPLYYQDMGEGSTGGACPAGTKVTDAYNFFDMWGRTADPFVPVVGYHLLPEFLPSGFGL